jgi:hypothetical protein
MTFDMDNKPEKLTAIEVTDHEVWGILCALQPHLKELDANANIGNFVVVSGGGLWPGAIMSPATIAVHFDRIEPDGRPIKTVKIIR